MLVYRCGALRLRDGPFGFAQGRLWATQYAAPCGAEHRLLRALPLQEAGASLLSVLAWA
jgi:hypothetical protein